MFDVNNTSFFFFQQDIESIIKRNDLELSFGIIFVNDTKFIHDLPTKINQNVQFVVVETWKVYECYKINGIKTMRQLGFFDINFHYIPITTLSFEERRSDFHGYKTKVMVEAWTPYLTLNLNPAILDANSETYDVTNLTKGREYDLLMDLQHYMNFTTTIHKRQDGKWGPTKRLENGTIVTSGIVESVTSGFAEMNLW